MTMTLTTEQKIDAVYHALHDNSETNEPGILTMKRHYYGLDGSMGDRRRVKIIWRLGGFLIFLLGVGSREVVSALIHTLFSRG